MPLFNAKKSYIGVDLGTSSIKIVQLENFKGRPKLVTYGYLEQVANIIKDDSPQARDQVVQTLGKIVRTASITTKEVIAAVPSFAVFSSIISLPSMSSKDLVSAVRWEAKKFVPMPLEEMILDWRILKGETKQPKSKTYPLSSSERKQRYLEILLTAAPKNLVKRYIDTFKQTKFQLISLETEAFALQRSLLGEDKSVVMLVDIGAYATNISIISEGVPVLNRSIDVGGMSITKAIAKVLNVDLSRAEQFKRDFGMTEGEGAESQIPKTIEFVISSIINEIKYCFDIYQNQEAKSIEKIVLAGGSSFLPQLPEYFSRILNLRVYIGDPWSRVVYPVDLEPVLKEIGPRFAVAVGLAMRNLV